MSLAPGWYADENNAELERYWNGSRWQDETRPAQGAPAVELTVVHAGASASTNSKLRETGDLLLGLAVLVSLGSIIGGGILVAHSITDVDGMRTHPFVGVGAAVIVGGILQSIVLLCWVNSLEACTMYARLSLRASATGPAAANQMDRICRRACVLHSSVSGRGAALWGSVYRALTSDPLRHAVTITATGPFGPVPISSYDIDLEALRYTVPSALGQCV